MSKISLIIPTYDRNAQLMRLLHSIEELDYNHSLIEVVIVDNANSSNLKKLLSSQFSKCKLIQLSTNVYSAGARQVGLEESTGDYVLFIDDDNVLDTKFLEMITDCFESDSSIGIVGPLMCYYSHPKIIWCAAGRIDILGRVSYDHASQNISSIKGLQFIANDITFFPNVFAVRREVFVNTNFDTKLFPHNWSEPDFCIRAKRDGWKVIGAVKAVTYHDIDYFGKLTRLNTNTIYDQAMSRILFRKKFLHTFLPWTLFILIIFPVSTAYYFKSIIRQKGQSKMLLVAKYISGTLAGFKTNVN